MREVVVQFVTLLVLIARSVLRLDANQACSCLTKSSKVVVFNFVKIGHDPESFFINGFLLFFQV